MNNIIPAVDKTIQLLQVLAGRDATQSELSRELGITMSSAYRILMTLQHHNWVRKKSGASYALSEGILPLLHGVAEDMSVLERACRQVADIAENRNMACKLSIRRGGEQLTYFRAEPPGPVSLTGQSGSTFPLIEGSVGAALLSGEPPEKVEEAIAECPADIPEKQNPELLRAGIREVQEHGCVLNLRRNRWNIAAFSIPLHDCVGRVVAALTLIGNQEDFTGKERRRWEKILKDAARECEKSES